MNTSSNSVPESPINSGVTDPGYNTAATRPLYWSVWRELWENRSIYIAPLIVAAVQVFGFAISTIGLADRRRAVLLLDPARQRAAIEMPYDIAARSYGSSMAARWCAGSSSNTARLRSARPIVLIAKPNTWTAATISGTTYIERFSHTSRRTDQYIGRVAGMAAGVIACESLVDSGTVFD